MKISSPSKLNACTKKKKEALLVQSPPFTVRGENVGRYSYSDLVPRRESQWVQPFPSLEVPSGLGRTLDLGRLGVRGTRKMQVWVILVGGGCEEGTGGEKVGCGWVWWGGGEGRERSESVYVTNCWECTGNTPENENFAHLWNMEKFGNMYFKTLNRFTFVKPHRQEANNHRTSKQTSETHARHTSADRENP